MNIDENEFFRQATLRICSSLDLDVALKRFLEYLAGIMPASGAFMGYYQPDANQARLAASAWPFHDFTMKKKITLPPAIRPLVMKHWENDPLINFDDIPNPETPESSEILSLLTPLTEASFVSVSLRLGSERIGNFSLFADGLGHFTEEHGRILKLLHDPLAVAMNNALRHQEILRLKDLLEDDNRYLHKRLAEVSGDTIVGADFGLRGVMEMVRQVAHLDSPVLLLGETGVGKEIIANALHYASSRREGPFIKMNCGALPEGLIDSELFGHEKGAFTGAVGMKRGRFERADMGTIFLDEIGELPPAAQVRLLRVIQHQEIDRIGGSEPIPVNVRIISATHRNLDEMVRAGRFREDLWYRLNVFPIRIPPLRQRIQDIPALVAHFIERKSRDLKIQSRRTPAPGELEKLQSRPWPGNVRELENVVERALIHSQAGAGNDRLVFDMASGPPAAPACAPPPEGGRLPILDEVVSDYIRQVLERTGGRVEGQGGAARVLGLHPSTLRARMRKLGIPHGRKAGRAGG